ncbi:response regulator transcription factor [Streptococcus merionis]|uniref:Transcriptional regulatory protein DltR n=1 Tax=Streptococcus merionis TaxID=400065 RepID=A0A239SPP5_9STRE|nr:response regulator transcription factor [Streptococcus merionis]SNU87441.1 two-component response transcriptional regulator [Streptococcus merionis]
MTKILIVEDDKDINNLIKEVLEGADYQTESIFNGKDALELIQQEKYDLVILDIMLPVINGLDVLREVRTFCEVPIIMLTGVDDEYTQLLSFKQLIADYIVKPFSPLVLVERVKNVLRLNTAKSEMTIGDLHVDFEACAVSWKGESVRLTKKEFQILELLVKRCDCLVTRAQLMQTIWGYGELETRVLDNHIKHIRKKIAGIPLKTMPGLGYILES